MFSTELPSPYYDEDICAEIYNTGEKQQKTQVQQVLIYKAINFERTKGST